MTLRLERQLDRTDWKILRELQQNARLSFNELGRRVGLSSPSTAERVRKLEDAGIVTGYHARIDARKIGLPLSAFIQLRCAEGRCLFKTGRAEDFPEVLEMHKTSGSYCALLKVVIGSMEHLEALNERLGHYGEQITTLVTSSVLTDRTLDREQVEVDDGAPRSKGWNVG
jgi:Lrp/AsnC family transcriptional regulator, leucine-responsive regulatory protein